jgi:hypothetical protein
MRTLNYLMLSATYRRLSRSRKFKKFRLPRKVKKKYMLYRGRPVYPSVYNQEQYDYYKYYHRNK